MYLCSSTKIRFYQHFGRLRPLSRTQVYFIKPSSISWTSTLKIGAIIFIIINAYLLSSFLCWSYALTCFQIWWWERGVVSVQVSTKDTYVYLFWKISLCKAERQSRFSVLHQYFANDSFQSLFTSSVFAYFCILGQLLCPFVGLGNRWDPLLFTNKSSVPWKIA